MKYVYCLAKDVNSNDAFPPGLGGTKVHHVSFEGISALISDVDSDQLAGDVQNAMAHQEVVNAALKFSKSVIPCRFRTLFLDDEKILALLKKHYALLDAQLARLEGKIEVSVQVIFNQRESTRSVSTAIPETPKAEGQKESLMDGINYLLKKKERFDAIKELSEKADRFSREMNQAMSPLWSEVKVQKRSTDKTLLLSLCYLVDQQNLSSFKQVYQKFKRENPSLKLLYTGPWPPYSFVDLNLRKD